MRLDTDKTEKLKSIVLGVSVANAGIKLGLPMEEVGKIIDRNPSTITRNGVAPDSTSGQLALQLIRLYRGLYALVGGSEEEMAYWMHSSIGTLQGSPAELIRDSAGLESVVEYIDAMLHKT